MSRFLESGIEYLKGVGPAKGDLLKKEKNIFTFQDFLYDYPFRYVDKTQTQKIRSIRIDDAPILLKGQLLELYKRGEGRRQRLHGILDDGSGNIELTWFQGVSFLEKSLVTGATYLCYGKVNYYNGKKTMPHPELERVDDVPDEKLGQLSPVYSTTEKLTQRGLNAKGLARLKKVLLEQMNQGDVPETIPDYVMTRLKLIPKTKALWQIHFPKNWNELKAAKKRLKFEEFFFMQLRLWKRYKQRKSILSYTFEKIGKNFNSFYKNHLPFELTNAQKRVVKEIRKDMGTGFQMNRLLQGDVGSGKTIVALLSVLMAIDNGFQACLMAPTEILAQQHFNGLKALLEGTSIRVDLLTGSIKGTKRKKILEDLIQGHIHLLIGTHAVIEDPVQFHKLGLAITDEQHRFGVEQRAKLWKKASPYPPHILVMTATPIPRTLAMTVYGDLDVSTIDELPPGRKKIITNVVRDSKRGQMFSFMKEEIKKGRQIYIVFPLIEESMKLDLANLDQGYEYLLSQFPRPDYQISIVHGRMKSADKDLEMQQFVKGKTNILVATTVIEVGVNVPNASIMIIENAERFGLSQLHQLRGRVGRGNDQSYCILMAGNKLSKEGKERLRVMCETNDGFKIAEADLKLRGPGDIEGLRQSGDLDLNLADPISDGDILISSRKIAQIIMEDDPNLEKSINARLKAYMISAKERFRWSFVG
jgi:ATP-dependent DNA helicase RecG